jgi:hypothetical protein
MIKKRRGEREEREGERGKEEGKGEERRKKEKREGKGGQDTNIRTGFVRNSSRIPVDCQDGLGELPCLHKKINMKLFVTQSFWHLFLVSFQCTYSFIFFPFLSKINTDIVIKIR